MRKTSFWAAACLFIALLPPTAWAQQEPGTYIYKDRANVYHSGYLQDFRWGRMALPAGTTLPASCIANLEIFVDTDASPAGQQLYLCNNSGTGWNLVGDGGAGGSAHELLSLTHSDSTPASGVLGDLIFFNTTWTRLPGNTTTTRKLLRQLGDGAASATPDWDTLLAGDLPASYIDALGDFAGALCGTNQILEDQGASWACIATPAGGSDAKVAVFEAGVQVGTVGRRLDFITASDFVVTEDAANDQFDISIAAGAITDSLVAASGITTRSKLPAPVVYDDEVTTYGAFKQDFGAATVEIPNGITPPATCAVGEIFHDTDAAVGARYLLCTAVNTFTATDNPFGTAIDDAELASNYGGIGSCAANQFQTADNDNATPTCAVIADADIPAAVSRDTESPAAGDITGSLSGGYQIGAGAVASPELATANKTEQYAFTLFDPNGLAATDDVPSIIPNRARAVTITEVWCESDDGTAVINLQRDDGTPANILSANLTCTTGGATGTLDLAEDNVAVGNNIDFVFVSETATLRVNVAIKYTVD